MVTRIICWAPIQRKWYSCQIFALHVAIGEAGIFSILHLRHRKILVEVTLLYLVG